DLVNELALWEQSLHPEEIAIKAVPAPFKTNAKLGRAKGRTGTMHSTGLIEAMNAAKALKDAREA
ncbi:unnamed protein product, partial [Amoebophrya sp. A25]